MIPWSSALGRRLLATLVAGIAGGCGSSTTDHLGWDGRPTTAGAAGRYIASGEAGQLVAAAGQTYVAGQLSAAGQAPTSTTSTLPSRVVTQLLPKLPSCPPSYPNAYRDVLGWEPSEIRARLSSAFSKLIVDGDPNTESIYTDLNNGRAVIRDILHDNQARTEGMGVGMLVAVMLNRQDVFDRLWRYAKAELEIKSGPLAGYFNSYCDAHAADTSDDPKTQPCIDPFGFQQFVMALLLARQRFVPTASSPNYEDDVLHLFDVMRNKEYDQRAARAAAGGAGPGVTGTSKGGTAAGGAPGTSPGTVIIPASAGAFGEADGEDLATNLFDDATRLVYVEPTSKNNRIAATAHEIPGYYAVWYELTEDPYYAEAAQSARRFLVKVADPSTGLLPVRASFEGTASGEWGMFAPEAYRALLNLVIDRLWGTSSEWQTDQIDRMLKFFNKFGVNSSNVAAYGSAYSLNGETVYIQDHRTELVLVNGVIAMLSNLTSSEKRPFIEAAAAVTIPTGNTRYYPGILYLLSNLILAGEFRLCWSAT